MLTAVNSFELSPQQKYLWSLQQGDSFVYCAVCAVSITGNLQTEVLKTAINQVVGTYEILRTNYRDMPEMNLPLQFINNQGAFWHQEYDLSSDSYQAQEDNLKNIFNDFCNFKLNLKEDAVLNLSLVRLGNNKYILMVALPAICSDRLTLHNFIKQVSNSYISICHQEEALESEVLQYADLAAWQNELLIAEETKTGRDFWSNINFSALAALQLPFENTAAASLPFNPQSYCLKLDVDFQDKITNYAQAQNIAISDVLFTCWNILLWRLTGQDNLITGIVTDGRKYQELESVLGLLSKSLPISIHIQETDTFGKLWQKVKINLDTASTYEEYFYLEREAGFLPFTFEFEPQSPQYDAVEVKFSIHQQAVYIDRYKVKLSSYYQDNSLCLKLCYDANLFSADDIQRLTQQLCTLLESAIAFQNFPVSQLEVLDKAEKQKLLQTFNNTQVNYDRNQCIHQLFAERVINTPDKIALIFENETFTYTQLNNRANQIARYLQKLGIGAEVLVGLCVDRSPLMVLGILGILKAGGAYVPLDPTYPQERLAFMLQNSQPKVLLTQEHLKAELPAHETQVICIDKIGHIISQESTEDLTKSASASNLAYVIYTSGSTGKPKGVRVTHANLCHYVQAMQQALGITADDVYLHTASLAFSSSVRQLMVPLTRGATVKIATQEQRQDPLALFQGIKQDNITVIDIVPSFWRNCNYTLASLSPESKSYWLDNKLRLIVSASEPLLSDIPINWKFGLQHQTHLINMFGQTETCGIVATYPITIEADAPTKVIPLGKPIANTQIYLLDQHLQPVPIGVAGELYIGGWGIGQGYLHRPDLTAERFIPNPFSHELGARLYKTGDLGRYLADGTIEFIGRSDYQVKIRGFRIELTEIEAVLTQYTQIREAVVIAQENENSDKRLVAYLVVDQATSFKLNDLNKFLINRLPDYMLPSSFVMLEALPLTPNGKINRNLLPKLQQTRNNLEGEFVAPRYKIEEVITGIWQDLLSVQEVGIYDNFFELGGHSLLATQVIYKMREVLQIELPLRTLFDSPTVAGIAEHITNNQDRVDGVLNLSIAPNPEERYQPFPLTDIQQAYWIGRNGAFDLSNVATHAYREIDCLNLDLDRFNTAWQRLIERHDMLRAIVQPNGQQRILAQVPAYEIKVLDLRGESEEIREFRLAEIRDRMSHQVLPANKWPLFEISAIRLSENKIRLYLSFDLLIGDAWSYQIIGRELAELVQNPDTSLEALEISFRDYVLGEIALRNTELYSRALKYWQSRIITLPPSPELSLAKNLVVINNPRFDRRTGNLASDAWLRLQSKARQIGVTPSIILLAAYAEILTVWSKSPRFTINLTLFNRLPLHPQINQIVGDFTTLNLLAVDNSEVNSFTVRAQRIQQQLWDDLDHRYVSGVQVLRELVQTQERSLGAIMPVVFTSTLSQDAQGDSTSPLDWLGECVYSSSQTPQVYLDHVVSEVAGELVFYWNAVEEIFPSGLLDDAFSVYCNFLTSLANEDEIWYTKTSQLLAAKQQELILRINATDVVIEPTLTLHNLFFDRVHVYADKAAVIASDRTLTYQELSDRSLHIAHNLRQLGVCPQQHVAIVMDKGWEQIVAALGILAAGAVYVPIDPKLPIKRRCYLLQEAEIEQVITQSWLDSTLDWPSNITRICADILEPSLADFPPPFIPSPTSLAYIIYTSGSTGLPKGVMIDHQGAVNTIVDINCRFNVTSTDRVIALSSLSFDLSVYDIFGTLGAGATIIIPDADAGKNPEHWVKLLVQHQVTIWNSVPALMQVLLEYVGDRQELLHSCLRLVLLSGDWISLNLPSQIWMMWENAQVISLGGATEASIWSIVYPITTVDPTWKSIPYGRPMANQRFYVLDAALEHRPVWVPGQLYIGGIGLAQGYWKNPDKTNASFIIHPHTQERLYKTGDLGRYLPDGNIEFLGREDFQVKVNGYRIELGEIESAIQQHPVIKDVAVNVVGKSQDNKQLVAYVVLNSPEALPADGDLYSLLRNFLQQKLPEYMLPAAYILLDALPLTSNGKVDRRSLPAPENLRPQVQPSDTVPTTEIEKSIANIWQDLLAVEQVNREDNFFELGGNSLTAMQLVIRIRTSFNIDLPLPKLFTYPTVKSLAEIVEDMIGAPSQQQQIIPKRSQLNHVPLSFSQQRLWFIEQLQPDSTIYNFPMVLRLNGQLNVEALEQSINEIIKRHEILRTTFNILDGQPVQIIAPAWNLQLSLVDLTSSTTSAEELVTKFILEEEAQPFDLSNGPLMRASLLQLAEIEHILLFTMHHIITDGWSMGILMSEIAPLYAAFSTGKTIKLPELTIQYADFAVWQRQHLQGERREALLTYWKQQLANLPVLQLPTTHPRAEVKTSRGASHTFVIPASVVQEVRHLAQQAGVTLFMTLLASFKILLQRYTKQDDIVVGTDVANRNQAEIEPLIGFFINLLVLRTNLSANPTFLELLQRVRTQTLSAYAHQDLPFDELVRELQPERHLSNTVPLFQVLFVLQNTPISALKLPGLNLKLLELETKNSRFDLALFLTETEQGIEGKWQYNADLFAADTITIITKTWKTLINSIIHQPESHINTLEMLTEAEKAQQTMQQQERKAAKRQKFMSIAPKAVSLIAEQLIKTDYLQGGQNFPLVIQPNTTEVDLLSWVDNNREYLETELLKHGAILFRGFNIRSVSEFENFAQTICPNLFAEYGDLPRTGEGGKVYGSTPYPPDKAILFHNESSHLHQWPLKIWFFCVQPAQQGGETPIIDCRKAYRLINPKLRERLEQKQLMYVRHYTNSLDVSWQTFFRTNDKLVVENYCRQAKIDVEWYDNNSLITRQVRPALAVHPNTSEPVFFNQIQLHHIAYLDVEVRESLLSTFGKQQLPRNVYYGDGTSIEDSVIAEINEVYQQSQTSFSWEQGDILMLDNMLTAHGRNPYIGSRKILVAMGEMIKEALS
ncbi:amino acid adenylation domain-containing protein [Nostoc sp. PCC 9305]|uniref:amino acid adenylation domain-containing protein n=1 Tax=Nostoc sp. PCC 9305 TaxID=296636 RepID=UPI0039C6DB8E